MPWSIPCGGASSRSRARQRDQQPGLPGNAVFLQMQQSERHRRHQDAARHAQAAHQQRLQKAAKNQLLAQRPERHAEQGDQNTTMPVRQQLAHRSGRFGRLQRRRSPGPPETPAARHTRRSRPASSAGPSSPWMTPERPAILRAEHQPDTQEQDTGSRETAPATASIHRSARAGGTASESRYRHNPRDQARHRSRGRRTDRGIPRTGRARAAGGRRGCSVRGSAGRFGGGSGSGNPDRSSFTLDQRGRQQRQHDLVMSGDGDARAARLARAAAPPRSPAAGSAGENPDSTVVNSASGYPRLRTAETAFRKTSGSTTAEPTFR